MRDGSFCRIEDAGVGNVSRKAFVVDAHAAELLAAQSRMLVHWSLVSQC